MPEQFAVDPANPGEVLACAGLAWLAGVATPDAETGFAETGNRWEFRAPFPAELLNQLTVAAPELEQDYVKVAGLRLDWWQRPWGLNPAFKFWAGQQTAASVLGNLLRACRGGSIDDWLNYAAPTGGRLGVDPRGTWDALSLGWSINEHKHIRMLCRPFVETLAFLGLQVFPVQGDRQQGLRYHLWYPCRLTIARLAFAGYGGHKGPGHVAQTEKSGSNTYLKPATPV